MGWARILATFSQTHLVTLVVHRGKKSIQSLEPIFSFSQMGIRLSCNYEMHFSKKSLRFYAGKMKKVD
jgi:hypothetical protein